MATQSHVNLQKKFRKSFNWKYALAEILSRELFGKTYQLQVMYRELSNAGYEWNGEYWLVKLPAQPATGSASADGAEAEGE